MKESRKLIVDPKTGKISLAKTIKNCNNCQKYSNQVQNLKKTVFDLKQNIVYYQNREIQMNIICQQIEKTKQKLEVKLAMRGKQLTQSIGMSGLLDGNGVNDELMRSSKGMTERLKSISMYSLGRNKGKDLSTERSWNF